MGSIIVYRIELKDGFWFTESYSTLAPDRKLRLKWKSGVDMQFLLWYYSNSQEGYPSLPILEIAFWDEGV